jgi:Neprosin
MMHLLCARDPTTIVETPQKNERTMSISSQDWGCLSYLGHCYAWDDQSGWVQVSDTKGHHPGDPVTVTSNPEQYGILYYQGNWWVNYQNDWIGYFPGSRWSNFTQFTKARWYGEVSHRLIEGGCTQMGNGTYGSQPKSAVITDMGFINFDGSQTQANSTGYVTDGFYYDMENFNGHSFTYGGPGQCAR